MKRLLSILVVILIVINFNYTARAVEGHLLLEYNLMRKGGNITDRGGIGEIYLYQEIFDNKFRIAGRMKTSLMGFNLKGDVIPAGIPGAQTYDLELSYKITSKLTISLIEGCKHYFSQSGKSRYNDSSYIKVKTKYEF